MTISMREVRCTSHPYTLKPGAAGPMISIPYPSHTSTVIILGAPGTIGEPRSRRWAHTPRDEQPLHYYRTVSFQLGNTFNAMTKFRIKDQWKFGFMPFSLVLNLGFRIDCGKSIRGAGTTRYRGYLGRCEGSRIVR
jgi:hypothetical protein